MINKYQGYNSTMAPKEWLISKFNLPEHSIDMEWKSDIYGNSLRYRYLDTCKKKFQNELAISQEKNDLVDSLGIPKEIISNCKNLRLGLCSVEIKADTTTIPVVKLVYELLGKELSYES